MTNASVGQSVSQSSTLPGDAVDRINDPVVFIYWIVSKSRGFS